MIKRFFLVLKIFILIILFSLLGYIVFFIKKEQAKYYSNVIVPFMYSKRPGLLFGYNILDKYNIYCKNTKKKLFCQSFIYQGLFRDILWISRIQYIGSIVQRQKIPYFSEMINSVSALDPNKYYPYVFAQLVGPISKNSNVNIETKKQSWINTVNLGKKGMYYVCSGDICPDYKLPNYLAFNYFYYLKSDKLAEKYYIIASKQKDAPEITKYMPAIVAGNLNNHLKAMNLWFSRLPKNIDFKNNFQFKEYEKNIKKSVFELSLYIIQQSSNIALKKGECLQDFDCLKINGYLNNQIFKTINLCKKFSKNKKNKTELIKTLTGNKSLDKVFCQVLFLGLQNNWIKVNGELNYPFNNGKRNFKYAWNKVVDKWWIVSN